MIGGRPANTIGSGDGTTMAFDRLGDGPPVVLIGAGPTDRATNPGRIPTTLMPDGGWCGP